MYYLEDEELARQLVELGYRGNGETLKREEFEARKKAEREKNSQKSKKPNCPLPHLIYRSRHFASVGKPRGIVRWKVSRSYSWHRTTLAKRLVVISTTPIGTYQHATTQLSDGN